MGSIRDTAIRQMARFWFLFAISLTPLCVMIYFGPFDWSNAACLFILLLAFHIWEIPIHYSQIFWAILIFVSTIVALFSLLIPNGWFALVIYLIIVPGLFQTRPIKPAGDCYFCGRAIFWPYMRRNVIGELKGYCKECYRYFEEPTRR